MICCFTGHRVIPVDEVASVRERLLQTIEELARQGVREFRAGGALGFDTLAAYAVLECKERYPQISLRLILPCADQTRSWPAQDRRRYEELLERADKVEVLSPYYYRGCMHVRNRALVDGSDVCVAFQRYNTGGTYWTVNYAQKENVKIINLGE